MATTAEFQDKCRRLVDREVNCCLSSLVHTLAQGYYGATVREAPSDIVDLCEQAAELAAPIPDYEEAARQAGWRTYEGADGKSYVYRTISADAEVEESLDRKSTRMNSSH